jgi:hypothetical protein
MKRGELSPHDWRYRNPVADAERHIFFSMREQSQQKTTNFLLSLYSRWLPKRR